MSYRVENPGRGDQDRVDIPPTVGQTLRLVVPRAPHRPGDEPRFARFVQQPRDLPRPKTLCDYTELRPHAQGLVRVLDDDGNAAGAWDPGLQPAVIRKGLEWMLTVRAMDARMLKMQRQGRLSFYLECRGEEAIAVAGGMAVAEGDLLFPAYRQGGLFLVRGMPMVDMMCQCIGNRRDISHGRQMPLHYSWKAGNIVSISSPVGTQFPQAVGAAMAAAYRHKPQVTLAWMGDGTTAQGDFHYALNFASVYRPPVVLQVVDNQWAISTHRNLATGGPTFAARADSYAIPGIRVDGNDFLAVFAVTSWAVERARRGGGPTLIELLTYRKAAHSTSDDPNRYRPGDEARLWPGGDPIERLSQHLRNIDEWSPDRERRFLKKIDEQVAETYKQAETYGTFADGPYDSPETIFDDVLVHPTQLLELQRRRLAGEQGDSTKAAG